MPVEADAVTLSRGLHGPHGRELGCCPLSSLQLEERLELIWLQLGEGTADANCRKLGDCMT